MGRNRNFLDVLPTHVKQKLQLEEQTFLEQALQTRKALLETLNLLLAQPETLSVKDVAQALKILQEQIREAKKDLAVLKESVGEEDKEEEIVDIDTNLLNKPEILTI